MFLMSIVAVATSCGAIIVMIPLLKAWYAPEEYLDSESSLEVLSTGDIVVKERFALMLGGATPRESLCFLYPNTIEREQGVVPLVTTLSGVASERKQIALYPREHARGLEICYGQRGATLPQGLHRFSYTLKIGGRVELLQDSDRLVTALPSVPGLPQREASLAVFFPVLIQAGGVSRLLTPEMITAQAEVSPQQDDSTSLQPVIQKRQENGGTRVLVTLPSRNWLFDKMVSVTLSWPAQRYIDRTVPPSGKGSGASSRE
jgi:hypothetical protein